ncbi:MAG: hypothetical protein WCV84_03115 [Patescibacteria group bacterium]
MSDIDQRPDGQDSQSRISVPGSERDESSGSKLLPQNMRWINFALSAAKKCGVVTSTDIVGADRVGFALFLSQIESADSRAAILSKFTKMPFELALTLVKRFPAETFEEMVLAWFDEGQLKPEELFTLLRMDELMKAVPTRFLQNLLRQRLLHDPSWIPSTKDLDPTAIKAKRAEAIAFLGILFVGYLATSAEPNPADRLIKAIGWGVFGANPDFERVMNLATISTKENMGVTDLKLLLVQLLGTANKHLGDFNPEDFLPGLVVVAEEFKLGEEPTPPALSRELVVIPPETPPVEPASPAEKPSEGDESSVPQPPPTRDVEILDPDDVVAEESGSEPIVPPPPQPPPLPSS